jgi:outer membrane protein OmpA-like peptidoglycan-associated protein/ABC-type nitrate/sulfonate/bicarbonate transport system substrate-binding protein
MHKLTRISKLMIAGFAIACGFGIVRTRGQELASLSAPAIAAPSAEPPLPVVSAPSAPALAPAASVRPVLGRRIKVALSQWPGHMALVLGAGGLSTQPGSIAAEEKLDLEIVFIEDAPSKNKALATGEVDFVWQTVDELPISLAVYRAAKVDVRAFLQIDWSRGGDACVASREVKKVEDILGRKSAMMLFSPDHTVFEFMLTNSRLTPQEVQQVRKSTSFSPDDFTYGRVLFEKGQVDVACLWEPDVTLALAARPGAHRLFSTADATELVADVLLAKQELLQQHSEVAEKLARVWFRSVERGARDPQAAATLISNSASRFRDELGYDKTLAALEWAKWTDLADNVRFFGLDGSAPAFDRVYNQADSIWINYPEAEIKDRFAPSVLRNDGAVRKIWESAGKPLARADERYDAAVGRAGAALFTKPLTINFPTAGSELSSESMAIINQQILPQLEIARTMYARIEGNTDSVGDAEANQALSERRADAIVEYLVARGIARERLSARGNGSKNPIDSNKLPEGRARNRRTDVLFIRGGKP